MDPYAAPDFLYELIKKCTQTEFAQATLNQIKTAHASINLKNSNKKKDDLISDIFRFLSNILIRQTGPGQNKDGFPLFNQKNELFQRNASIQHLIDTCNQKIHIANVHLAQINHSKLNQVKKALNISEGQSLCICSQTIDATHPKENLIKCINAKCGKQLHRACMKMKIDEEDPLFECPECVLFKCDPLHEVIKSMIYPYVVDNQSREFWIDDMIHKEIQSNDNLGIEVRVINLESKSHEQSWPHNGELEVNQFRVLEFKPLQSNSSLKKRKDEKLFTNSVVPGLNSVKLKYLKGSDPRNPQAEETYIAAVYLVKKLTCEELVQRIKEGNIRSIEESKKIIIDEFENASVDIDKVVCQLTCVFDLQPLKTPAKGVHCKHPSCFSLENYVKLWQKNPQRKWTCPICKVKAYDLVIDAYMEKILEDSKKSGFESVVGVDVEIMRNGEYRFVKNELENENNEEKKIETKIEKPADNVDVIVLDSDEEENGQPAAAKTNGNVEVEKEKEKEKEPLAEEPKEPAKTTDEETTEKPTPMEVENENEKEKEAETEKETEKEKEKEKEKQPSEEESKEATEKPEKTDGNADGASSSEAPGEGSSKKMEEEKDQKDSKTIQIEDNDDQPVGSLDDMTRPDEHMNDVHPIPTKPKPKPTETMEEESAAPVEKPKKEKKKQQKEQKEQQQQLEVPSQQDILARDQQSLLQAALEQFQLQASEEYRLQQQRQLQQQQRMQWLAESLSVPGMAQGLQNLQGVNLGTLFGLFGNNSNVFQQAINAIPALLMNQLKAKLQQQVGRASPEDLAALLLGDSPYKAAFGGGDMNYNANLMRQMNELAMIQALGINGMNGLNNVPLLNGINALNGLNPSALQQLLLQQQQQQQQNKPADVPSVNPPRHIPVSPPPVVEKTLTKPQTSKPSVVETEDNSSTLGNVISRPPEVVTIPIIPYKRKFENAPKVFKMDRELPSTRIMEDAKKCIEKQIELSEKKLELPTFENFKEITYPELKKIKEPNLQKNKKLVALVMKQFPGQYRSARATKATEEQEQNPDQPTVSVNEPMETEDKVQGQDQQQEQQQQQQQQQQQPLTEEQQQELANVRAQGQESDPICLE